MSKSTRFVHLSPAENYDTKNDDGRDNIKIIITNNSETIFYKKKNCQLFIMNLILQMDLILQ